MDFDIIHNRRGTGCIKWDMMPEQFAAEDLIPMWIADTEFLAPPRVMEEICGRAAQGIYGYGCRPPEYALSLAQWLKSRHGWETDPGSVCFSPGVVPALAAAVNAFTSPGGRVLLQSPVYTPFFDVVRNNGREVVDSELIYGGSRYEINFDDLEAKLSSGVELFLFCSPQNPTGRVWTPEETRRVAGLCVKYGVVVVSDDIHSDIVYSPYEYTPLCLAADGIEKLCVTCYSPSKTFNVAGLASSGAVIPDAGLRARFERVMRAQETGGNIFGDIAFVSCYKHGAQYADELTAYLCRNRDLIARELERFAPDVEAVVPEGTFLLLLRCPGLEYRGCELRDFFAREAKVGLQSGSIYGKSAADCVRMNFACSRGQLKTALERMTAALDKHLGR